MGPLVGCLALCHFDDSALVAQQAADGLIHLYRFAACSQGVGKGFPFRRPLRIGGAGLDGPASWDGLGSLRAMQEWLFADHLKMASFVATILDSPDRHLYPGTALTIRVELLCHPSTHPLADRTFAHLRRHLTSADAAPHSLALNGLLHMAESPKKPGNISLTNRYAALESDSTVLPGDEERALGQESFPSAEGSLAMAREALRFVRNPRQETKEKLLFAAETIDGFHLFQEPLLSEAVQGRSGREMRFGRSVSAGLVSSLAGPEPLDGVSKHAQAGEGHTTAGSDLRWSGNAEWL
ncbi:UNVERIFIED_CONTAM: hypothetical protein K2H54_005142 [Gekko kuhli]